MGKRFSFSHLAVNIFRCLASCCREQSSVLWWGPVPCHRTRKKMVCIGKKPESISESGAWPTFSGIGKAQIFCLAGLYIGGSNGPTRDQVTASFLNFLFSAGVPKTGGWTPSLVRCTSANTAWQGISESAAVAVGSELLALGEKLPLWKYWLSSRVKRFKWFINFGQWGRIHVKWNVHGFRKNS